MTQSAVATAADYADAMLVARRARKWLFAMLLVVMLAQLALFFVVYFRKVDLTALRPAEASVAVAEATTQGAIAPEAPAPLPVARTTGVLVAEYLIDLTSFAGIVLTALLAAVLLLILGIMLVGRLIGVARLTSAFIWCIVLGILLFPWQAFLNWPSLSGATFKIPGVLYTWSELVMGVPWDSGLGVEAMVVKWARFVGFPVVAIILLLMVHAKSGRGLRQALGESDVEMERGQAAPLSS